MSWAILRTSVGEQYLKFEDERTRPASELLARVPLDVATCVIDLGCGPGNSTRLLRTYEHVMPDVASIVDWVKGTGIRPYLAVLSEEEQAAYLDRYSRAIDVAYPQRADGKRLFTFPRIFIVAVR